MKGKVLGFTPSAGSGAISGDNGERFSFVAAQWRSEAPIAVGATVDFAPMAGVAIEIYSLGMLTGPRVSTLTKEAIMQEQLAVLFERLTSILIAVAALVLLIAVIGVWRTISFGWAIVYGMGGAFGLVMFFGLISEIICIRRHLASLDTKASVGRNVP